VFTMPPHTTALLILTHGDAADPILSAVQQPPLAAGSPCPGWPPHQTAAWNQPRGGAPATIPPTARWC
jgi:hypothetical protein